MHDANTIQTLEFPLSSSSAWIRSAPTSVFKRRCQTAPNPDSTSDSQDNGRHIRFLLAFLQTL